MLSPSHVAVVYAATHLRTGFQERTVLKLAVRLAQLFLSVHNDRAVPRYRLLQRLTTH